MSRLHIEYGLHWRWIPARVKRHIRDKDTMVLVASRDGWPYSPNFAVPVSVDR